MQRAKVKATVLVQAAPTLDETEFLLDLAEEYPWIWAVVGWVDLTAKEAPEVLSSLASKTKFRGVRPMLQDLREPDWILNAPNPMVWNTMVRLRLSLDALVKPNQLKALGHFAKNHGNLPLVVNHAAKPPLTRNWSGAELSEWRRDLANLARQPQVYCKFSGLLTEAARMDCASDATALAVIEPVWHFLLETFGPDRLIWSSDWPVLNLAAPYERWASVSESLIGQLSPDQQERVWSGNATSFYRLTP